MEAMKFGVPINAMPMHLDQPVNARLVVELGLGKEVLRDGNCVLSGHKMKGDEEIDIVADELLQLCNSAQPHRVVGSGLYKTKSEAFVLENLSTVHFLKILENSLEVLKVLKNSLEVLKVLKNSLEVLKVLQMELQENSSIDEMSADVARSHGGDGGGEDRPLHTMYPTVAWVALLTEAQHWVIDPMTGTYNVEKIRNIARAAQNRQNQAKSTVISRQGSRSLARLRDEMRQTSTTQEYPSLIDTFFVAHTVNGKFLREEDRCIYEEMRRLDMGSYTDDEISEGTLPVWVGLSRVVPAGVAGEGKRRRVPTIRTTRMRMAMAILSCVIYGAGVVRNIVTDLEKEVNGESIEWVFIERFAAGMNNRPLMLEESDFESWKIRIERYIRGKPLGKLIWKSIKNGPTPHPTITVTIREGEQQTQVTREKTDEEFTESENNKERHVAKECKEKKRAKDSQWFKDKGLLMEAKEKGVILDAEAEAFLADVE
nr:beta-D-glucosyl crocetin beta-1,6-glucosyltransferase-like [Tanacetum cinerariifolium]